MPARTLLDVVVPFDPVGDPATCLVGIMRHGGYDRLFVMVRGRSDGRLEDWARESSGDPSPPQVVHLDDRSGFATAANRGVLASRNDVVVVAPGAVVTRGWLDKLDRCARSDPAPGLVVPFSPGADPWQIAVPADGEDPERTNAAVEAAAVPLYPEVPIAASPCVLVRREAWHAVRGFDETLATAEAAVADFGERVRRAGYRIALADDTFIGGEQRDATAGTEASRQVATGLIVAKDTDLRADGRDFAEQDPLLPLRCAVRSQLAVVAGADKPGVLHVLHARGGGTEKHVRDLIASTSDRYRHYFLRILPDRWRVVDLHGATPDDYDYRWRLAEASDAPGSRYDFPRDPHDDRWLKDVCAWLRIDLCHVHSLVGSGDDMTRLLAASRVPYCYTAHDMYLPCPTIHLIDDRGEYCEATTDPDICRRCLAALGGYEHVEIARWRARYHDFLARAHRVFAPSRWAAETLATYFPDIAVVVVSPPAPRSASNVRDQAPPFDLPCDDRRHVALLGAIGPEKGARHLDALVARIRERELPLRIVVIGYTDRQARHQSDDRVLTVHGPYGVGEVATLLDHYRVQVVLFPTVWPETFSYTLGEAWAAGRPVLVPPRGALKDRVESTGAGWILDAWPDTDAMLDQLVRVTSSEHAKDREAAAARALAASAERDDDDAICRHYDAMLTRARPEPVPVSRMAIHVAASRALGRAPLASRPEAAPAPPYRRLLRILGKRT